MSSFCCRHQGAATEYNAACCGADNNNKFQEWALTEKKRYSDDAEFAKEMNELSVQEREKVFDDIHGVAQVAEETSEFLEKTVKNFDKALAAIPKSKKKWPLDRAFFLRPNLHTNTKFKLMFLRAEAYNVDKAVSRMMKFFKYKCDFFGEEKLGKDITMDDLDDMDIQTGILSGCAVELQHKDQTGRPIIVCDISKSDISLPMQMLKSSWYIFMSALKDEVAQIKGLTVVTYMPKKRPKQFQISEILDYVIMSVRSIADSLPVRITGFHYCTDSASLQFIHGLFRTSHGKDIRLRMRAHFGSELEMEYSLLTFGIRCSALLACGEGKTELHEEYMERRREKEWREAKSRQAEEERTDLIEHPSPKDALIGRGHPYHDFCGTRSLIEVIDSQLDRYFAATDRFLKTCITMETIKNFQESGGRLLRRTPSGWKVIDDTLVRVKIGSLFRYRYNLLRGESLPVSSEDSKLSKPWRPESQSVSKRLKR